MKKSTIHKRREVVAKKALPTKKGPVKRIKTEMSRAQFLKLVADCQKYPLSMRVAKEVFNARLKSDFIESKWAPSDSLFCRHVVDAMRGFEAEKGIDPDFVPSIAPVYYEVSKEPIRKTGRPGAVDAYKRVEKIVSELVAEGWEKTDFFDAVEEVSGPTQLTSVSIDSDDDPVIEVSLASLSAEAEAPTKKPAACVCAYCAHAVGEVYVVEESAGDTFFCHISCWRTNNLEILPPVSGEGIKDAPTGVKKYWSAEKKQFVTADEYRRLVK